MSERQLKFAREFDPAQVLKKTVKESQKDVKGAPKHELSVSVTEIRKNYGELLEQHQVLTDIVRNLRDQQDRLPSDKRQWSLDEKDKERHDVHLRLMEAARVLNKNEADVETDLLLLEGSTRELGVEIPLIESRDQGVHELLIIHLQHVPEFIAIARLSKTLHKMRDWNNPDARSRLEGYIQQVKEFFDRYDETLPDPKTGRDVVDRLKDIHNALHTTIDTQGDLNELRSDLQEELSGISNVLKIKMNLQSFTLPDEVILIFGVQSTPEAYGMKGEDRLAKRMKMTPVEDPFYETDHEEWADKERSRENMTMFCAGFEQRMHELQRLMDEEPLCRGWASGETDGHNLVRLFGLAVRKRFLPKVLGRIRKDPERYWKNVDNETSKTYVAGWGGDGESKYSTDTNIATGGQYRLSQVPELKAIPKQLKEEFHLTLVARDDHKAPDPHRHASKQIDGLYPEESERIWRIVNS